jgi:hypothetical protein
MLLAASGVGPDVPGAGAGVSVVPDPAAAPGGTAPPAPGLVIRPPLKPERLKPASLPGADGDADAGGELRN